MMRRVLAVTIMAIIAICLAGVGYAQPRKDLSRDEWLGVYYGEKKIGYRHIAICRDKLDGKDVYRKDDWVSFRVRYGSHGASSNVGCTSYFSMDYAPIKAIAKGNMNTFDATGKSNEESSHAESMELLFTSYSLAWKITNDGKTEQGEDCIPGESDRIKTSMYELGAKQLELGDKVKLICTFSIPEDDMSLQVLVQRCVDREVIKREKIAINGRSYHALVLKDGDRTRWETDDGVLLKEEVMNSPVTCLKETREAALKDVEILNRDPYKVYANRDILNPLFTQELSIRLIGQVDKSMIKNDRMQSVVFHPDKGMAEYHIASKGFDPVKSLLVPVTDKAYSKWIEESKGIECSKSEIRELASRIVAGEPSAYLAACKLRAWVYGSIKYKVGTPDGVSAVEVLNAKAGDCKAHAVLFTALARAVGIPTRLVGGLMYDEDNFEYHSWAECYVGEWVAFDPTIGVDFVNATHIKLSEGELDNLYDFEEALRKVLCKTLESFRIEVTDYEHSNGYRLPASSISSDTFVLSAGNCIVPFRKGDLAKALALLPKRAANSERLLLLCPDGVFIEFPRDRAPEGDICKLHGDAARGTLIVISKDGSIKRYPHGIKPGTSPKANPVSTSAQAPPGFDTYPTADGPIFYPHGYSVHSTSLGPAVLTPGSTFSLDAVYSDSDIPNAWRTKELNMRLIGPIDRSMIKNDRMQSAVFHPDKGMVEYHIASKGFDPAKSLLIPVRDRAYSKWIEESKGIECSKSEIRELASRIVAGEPSAYLAACKLRAWVYDNIKVTEETPFGVSAVEVLRAKVGGNTAHAVLFTALARALGIPTRLAGGLVCGGDNRFCFCTWAECYVGEWVAFEPTGNMGCFQAMHVKLWEGELETACDFETAVDKAICSTCKPFRIEVIGYKSLDGYKLMASCISSDTFVLSAGNCIVPFHRGDLPKALALLPTMAANSEQLLLMCPDGVFIEFPRDRAPEGDICKLHGDAVLGMLVVIGKDGNIKRYPHGIKPETAPAANTATAPAEAPPGFSTYCTADGPIFYPQGYSVQLARNGPAVLLPGSSLSDPCK